METEDETILRLMVEFLAALQPGQSFTTELAVEWVELRLFQERGPL